MSDSIQDNQSNNEPSKTVDDLEEKISREHSDSGKAGPSINEGDSGAENADDPSGDTTTAEGSATGEPPD
jgi:hypothetical protein